MKNIKALRGMPDILPGDIKKWQFIENAARALFNQYGYEEIRTPILEESALFKRTVGEETDIVQKQMYTFMDRGEREVSLRPEGTAPVVRAYLENGLNTQSALCKLYYIGPMFRSERPQAGRNRQFSQIGIEALGSNSPYVDAEIIELMMKVLSVCGLKDAELKLNTLGCAKDKKSFEQSLRKAMSGRVNALCEDCRRRYEKNILRIFDCKNESCRNLLRSAPKITDTICPDCKTHFDKVKESLDSVGIKYRVVPLLVRGLDYYTGTVFEVAHKNLGSQDALAAGGRYDTLVEELGGPKTPACGFAVGMERALLAAKEKIYTEDGRPAAFIIALGDKALKAGFEILADLRNKGISCQMDFDGKSLKSQMRLADKLKAKKVLIIGEDELKKGAAILRDMDKKEQKEIQLKNAADTHLW